MLNTFQFNTRGFNGPLVTTVAGSLGDIVFNGYSLQSSDIITQDLKQDSMPERSYDSNPVQRGNGETVLGDFWRKKHVRMRGVIAKSTNALLEAELDAMKKALFAPESDLDITIAGTVRRYTATLINGDQLFESREKYHITLCPFEAEFVCLDPFGHSVDYEYREWIDNTSLAFSEQIYNSGTAEAKPVVMLNFTAAAGVTSISFKNNTRGEEIILTKAIVAGDYVKFDAETMEVTVNGVLQDFSGYFPLLDTESNSVTITITGTSAVYTLTEKHKNSFF